MAAKKDNGHPQFDTSWIDELGLSDDARQAILEKTQGYVKQAEDFAGNLHAGMTKAQQRAAELEKEAARAQQWDAWKNDGNQPLLTRWGEVREIIDGAGGLDALRERVAKSAAKQADQQVQVVSDAYAGGEITWEQGQAMLRQIAGQQKQVDEVMQWYAQGRQEDYRRFEKAIADSAQASTQQLAAVFNPLVEAIEFSRRYPYDKFPEREVPVLLKTMGERGYRQLNEAVNSLWGETDTETRIRAELQAENEKTIIAEREKLRREIEKERGGGEGAAEAAGVTTFQSRRDAQGHRVARSPQEFMESVLRKVSKDAS